MTTPAFHDLEFTFAEVARERDASIDDWSCATVYLYCDNLSLGGVRNFYGSSDMRDIMMVVDITYRDDWDGHTLPDHLYDLTGVTWRYESATTLVSTY